MVTALDPVSNDGQYAINLSQPYAARFDVVGAAALLFHRWSNESVAEKSKAAKGSKAKKTDDVNSYVWRGDDGNLAIPGEYFRMATIGAAKFQQDPRSPRKSAMDLFKAGLVVIDEYCSLGQADWDYLDSRRAKVQMSAITRVRPAMLAGWRTQVMFTVLLPEYISPQLLNETVQSAGKLIGVGDFRPTFGRFAVTRFEVLND